MVPFLSFQTESMLRLPDVQRFETEGTLRVYRVPARVMPDLTGHVHLVLGGAHPVLIDAGGTGDDSLRDILDGLNTVRTEFAETFTLPDIRSILITHAHLDHVGGLPELLRLTGAQVGIHPFDRARLTHPEEELGLVEFRTRRFFAEAGVEAAHAEFLMREHVLPRQPHTKVPVLLDMNDGDMVDGLECIHTPGHFSGHLCFAIGDLLITGDHILAGTVPQQWPGTIRPLLGLATYYASLERIGRRPDLRRGLSGHERPIEDLSRRVAQVIAAQDRRTDRVFGAFEAVGRPMTVAEAAAQMYPQWQGYYETVALFDVGARMEHLLLLGRLKICNLPGISPTAGSDIPPGGLLYQAS